MSGSKKGADNVRKERQRNNKRAARSDEPMTLAEDVGLPGGRSGGNISREVATRDHLKRAFQRPGGPTRVQGRHKNPK